jgi:hypothetical protein
LPLALIREQSAALSAPLRLIRSKRYCVELGPDALTHHPGELPGTGRSRVGQDRGKLLAAEACREIRRAMQTATQEWLRAQE